MINRVLALTEVDGLPVVPGAENVSEQTDGHYTAHGPETKAPAGALNKSTHPTIARLWKAAPGLYAVAATPEVLAQLDPTSKGKSMADYGKTAAAATWPCKNEDGSCAISSVCGAGDPRPFKAHPVTIAEEPTPL